MGAQPDRYVLDKWAATNSTFRVRRGCRDNEPISRQNVAVAPEDDHLVQHNRVLL